MSGSSLDGTDLAYCEFTREDGKWDFQIIHAETIPYPSALKKRLEKIDSGDPVEVKKLDFTLGKYFGALINDFHEHYGIIPELIASHGHTFLHEPDKGITFQGGHGGLIADLTRIEVINDFRREDVTLGGQGAPLVPVGDRLLFGSFDACINLGGFANISFEDPAHRRIAFDVGPANLALNFIAGTVGQDFDEDGRMAARGTINQDLLCELNSLPYFRRKPPKSLGKLWFRQVFLPLIEKHRGSAPDIMSTVVEHLAIQLASSVAMACADNILVTGGGALNLSLMSRFTQHTRAAVHVPETELVLFKEALVFAFLGVLRKLGEVNCLSSVTGGPKDLSSGTIYPLLKP